MGVGATAQGSGAGRLSAAVRHPGRAARRAPVRSVAQRYEAGTEVVTGSHHEEIANRRGSTWGPSVLTRKEQVVGLI
ncbi:hypothetical protein GCM10009608_00840 [Pseudonocardia alaniniphila]